MGTYPADYLNYLGTQIQEGILSLNLPINIGQIIQVCHTYDGLVTSDDTIVKTGIFTIAMTNRSNKYIKVNKGQTVGMLRTCEEEQICTIYKNSHFS